MELQSSRVWSGLAVAVLAAGLVGAPIPLPSTDVASAKALRRTPPGRVLVVTANVHETNLADANDASDLKIFVRRMLKQVPRLPDVVVLQELWGRSATKVARLISRNSSDSYSVAVNAEDPPWRQPSATQVVGTDSAIVVNTKTMSIGRKGYLRLGYDVAKAAPNREVRIKRHPYAFVRERRGNFGLPVTSVHFPKAENFKNRKVNREIKGAWIKRINKRLGHMFPEKASRRARLIAGDVNNPRCKREKPVCATTPLYRIATDKLKYKDAIGAIHGFTNPIDYIFSKAPVVSSGLDAKAKGRKNRYSDHVFRWALLENKDRTGPTNPGRVRTVKGTPESVRLKGWDRVRDGGSGFAYFKVYRSQKGPDNGFRLSGRTGKTKFSDQDVERGVRYWYKVVAFDRAGNRSRQSPVVKVRAGQPPKDTPPRGNPTDKAPLPEMDSPLESVGDRSGPQEDATHGWAFDGPDFRPPNAKPPKVPAPTPPPKRGR